MSEVRRIRQSITLQLDVVIATECEDFLEVEITHPKLSGAMYITVNSRKELEEELDKIDLTDEEEDDDNGVSALKTFFSNSNSSGPSNSVIALGASSSYTSPAATQTYVSPTPIRQIGSTKINAAPVESLARNTASLAGGLIDLAVGLKNLRKKK